MRKTVVAIDMDGCLANFNAAYRKMLIQVSGRDLIPEGEEPPVWNYAPYYGYTFAENDAAWDAIMASRCFWEDLRPLPGAVEFLMSLDGMGIDAASDPDIYFVTSRPGPTAKVQTESWLERYGFPRPTVLIDRGGKGPLVQGLGVTNFLDDRPKNVAAAIEYGGEGIAAYLLHRRYNRDFSTFPTGRAHRIGTLTEFCVAVLREARSHKE